MKFTHADVKRVFSQYVFVLSLGEQKETSVLIPYS